jgi:hypothetical protein
MDFNLINPSVFCNPAFLPVLDMPAMPGAAAAGGGRRQGRAGSLQLSADSGGGGHDTAVSLGTGAGADDKDKMSCQVPGCGKDLTGLKDYHQRYRICDVHIKLPQVRAAQRLPSCRGRAACRRRPPAACRPPLRSTCCGAGAATRMPWLAGRPLLPLTCHLPLPTPPWPPTKVMKDGRLQRFCQQCGRFHDLSAFDGNRKSCREQLNKHNARRRRRAQLEQQTSAVPDDLMAIADEKSEVGRCCRGRPTASCRLAPAVLPAGSGAIQLPGAWQVGERWVGSARLAASLRCRCGGP